MIDAEENAQQKYVTFPDNLAIASQSDLPKQKIIFRNYQRTQRQIDKGLLDGESDEEDESSEEDAVDQEDDQGQQHLELVLNVEEMYKKKVAKAIKQQLKNEDDPIACLLPAKGKGNIDLKRGLNLKLSKLSLKTDKAILDILKEKKANESWTEKQK